MIFSVKNYKNKDLEKDYDQAMGELGEFFQIKWTRNRPNVYLVNDRETIDSLRSKNTPKWLVGWIRDNDVYLLSPDSYSSHSSHKYTRENYYKLLKHELAHLYMRIISKNNNKPDWLWEGVALYTAGQTNDEQPILTEFLSHYSKDVPNSDVYRESGYAVKYLVENYGKEKLLELLRSLPKAKNEVDFAEIFKDIYISDLNYQTFNK